jgi:hypothetical protein
MIAAGRPEIGKCIVGALCIIQYRLVLGCHIRAREARTVKGSDGERQFRRPVRGTTFAVEPLVPEPLNN